MDQDEAKELEGATVDQHKELLFLFDNRTKCFPYYTDPYIHEELERCLKNSKVSKKASLKDEEQLRLLKRRKIFTGTLTHFNKSLVKQAVESQFSGK